MKEDDPWSVILITISFVINSNVHTTSLLTPGQMSFGRDIILHTAHVANWEYIRLRKH